MRLGMLCTVAAGYGPFEPASNDLATALARLEAQQAELLQLLHAAQVSGLLMAHHCPMFGIGGPASFPANFIAISGGCTAPMSCGRC